MKPLVFLFAMLLLCTCSGQRVSNWEEDIDFWVGEVRKQHYLFRNNPLPSSFDARLRQVKSVIPEASDQRMLIELLGLSALLGDGHTYVLPYAARNVETRSLPFRFYSFSDGLFIIDSNPGKEEYIGKQVIKIGSESTLNLLKRVAPFVSRDNDQAINWIGPFLLPFQGMLEALDVPQKSGAYQLTFGDGSTQTFSTEIHRPTRGVPKLTPARNSSRAPLWLRNVSSPFWLTCLKNDRAIYFQFNQVMDEGGNTLSGFSAQLRDTLDRCHPEKLIIDVRHNNGGNAMLLPPLQDVLKDFRENKRGSLVILTGRNTFSAAQIFISLADKNLDPFFAGEPSSSKPNFVGEENGITLPHSGGIGSISNRYHESIPGDTRQWIEPDLTVVLSSTDYFEGRDPVLDAVLSRQ